MPWRAVVLVSCVLAAGCMVSNQKGQLVPDGNPRYWDQKLGEVTFHFDSTYNQGVVFGRSLALVLVALWVFASERGGKRVLTFVLGVPLVLGAAFLLVRDLPTLRHYRIAVLDDGLTLEIPPEPAREIPWAAIDSLFVSGRELKRGPADPRGRNPFVDVPEWERMELRTTGGESFEVDLSRLSWEQRQSVWKAIVVRAGLSPEK
jgi:hypothetical protein